MGSKILIKIGKASKYIGKTAIESFHIFDIMISKNVILNTLNSHKNELAMCGISKVGLFGSYLRNEQNEKSDIDLLIDFEPDKENFDNLMTAYDIFERIFKPERVEVITKNGLSPYIGPKILSEVLYV